MFMVCSQRRNTAARGRSIASRGYVEANVMGGEAESGLSGPRHRFHFVPDSWVTLSLLLQGAGGVDAVENEFGDGRAPSLRRPPAGGRSHDGPVPGVRHIAHDRVQDLYPLQGARLSGSDRPLTAADPVRQPAPPPG